MFTTSPTIDLLIGLGVCLTLLIPAGIAKIINDHV